MSVKSREELLRQRKFQNTQFLDDSINNEENYQRIDRKKIISTEAILWGVLIVWHLFNFSLIYYKNYDFPKPLSDIEAGSNRFSEERARQFLYGLTSLGVRIVGSEANEEKAVKFILKELDSIKASSRGKLEINLQEASGAFDLDFLGGFTNVYDKIKNIVVRLHSHSAHRMPALLINCHYDSALSSPGASDDAVSCASMVEVLRVMASVQELQCDVIFLFNGAEETILQGSHAFVTQHKWFRDVKAFINLEAAGSNGKQMLFQATPGAEWMVELYARVAPDPNFSVLGQEIFQSGSIPSDTDFRVFRDFAGLPGVDMAYIRNGYVYHTRHDNHQQISPGCLQKSGENLLSLVHAIATSQALTSQDTPPTERKRLSFVDLSGLMIVLFSANYLFLFNGVVVIATFLKVYLSCASKTIYKKFFKSAMLFIPLTCTTSLLVSSLIGLFLDAIGWPMTWYSRPWLLFPLYALPSLAVTLLCVHVFKSYWTKRIASSQSLVGQVLNDAQMTYAGAVLALFTCFQIASSFMLTAILLFFFVQSFTFTFFPSKLSTHFTSPRLAFHFLLSLPSIFILSFCVDGLFSTFIPIMGRSGSTLICDVVMALIVSIATTLLSSLHLSLLVTMPRLKKTSAVLAAVCAFFIIIVITTPLGYPFSDHLQHPTNKRIFIQHIRRRFHGDAWTSSKTPRREDNSLVLIPLDRTGLQHLDADGGSSFSEGFVARPCLSEVAYCGWAFHVPAIHMVNKLYYKEAPVLEVEGVQVLFGKPLLTSSSSIRHSFNVTGPNYMNVYLSVPQNLQVLECSHGVVKPTAMPPHLSPRKHFFFSVVSASGSRSSHHFHFTLKCPERMDCGVGMVQVAVVSNYFEAPTSETLTSLKLPPWTAPVFAESTLDSWNL